jgi:hypothetical protein
MKQGWISKAMQALLPRWGMPGHEIPAPCVKGVPDEDHIDPRFRAAEYQEHGGNITLAMMVGLDHSTGGRWVMQDYTPEQCVEIVASILSRPSVEAVAQPLLDALMPKVGFLDVEQRVRAVLAAQWGDHNQWKDVRERILDGSCFIHSDPMSLSSSMALCAMQKLATTNDEAVAEIRRLCAEGTEGHGDEFYGPILAQLDMIAGKSEPKIVEQQTAHVGICQDSDRALMVRITFPFDIGDWASGNSAIAETPEGVDPMSDGDLLRRYDEQDVERKRLVKMIKTTVKPIIADCYRVLTERDERIGEDRVSYGMRHEEWRRTRQGDRPRPDR